MCDGDGLLIVVGVVVLKNTWFENRNQIKFSKIK